jgi:hypothetical protein
MKISTRKSDKNKISSKINENLSSKNNNLIDENQNNLNNSKNNENTNNNLIEKSKEDLQNLKYIFPFLKEELNNSENNNKENKYSLSEYNKIVSSINKNKSNININKNDEDILKGKTNIIDKVIYKHMPSSADSKVIKIHEGLTSLTLKIDKNFNMMNDIGFRLPNLIELNLQNS